MYITWKFKSSEHELEKPDYIAQLFINSGTIQSVCFISG